MKAPAQHPDLKDSPPAKGAPHSIQFEEAPPSKGSSRAAGEGLFCYYCAVFTNRQCISNNPSDMIATLGQATSLCWRS